MIIISLQTLHFSINIAIFSGAASALLFILPVPDSGSGYVCLTRVVFIPSGLYLHFNLIWHNQYPFLWPMFAVLAVS